MDRVGLPGHGSPMLGGHALGTLLPVCALIGTLGLGHARAQSCHAPLGRLALEGWSASVSLREATVDQAPRDASYQGALLGVGYGAPRYELNGVLPAYRVDAGDGAYVGLSDVVLDARVALLSVTDRARSVHTPLSTGIELAGSLPTGSRARRLGMGHVMLMPGLYARARDEHTTLLLQAGYARALRAAGHDHSASPHHELGPLVDPMNASELTAALTLSASLARHLALLASLAAALPIATEAGVARSAAGLGVGWELAPTLVSLNVELPIIGDPFEQRVTLSVALAP